MNINILRCIICAPILACCISLHGTYTKAATVVSADTQATAAGMQILEQGGNAFDAAAAVALALGVAEPASSGFGGGGFFLLYKAEDNSYVMLDARETAPQLAGHGEVYDRYSSMDGAAAAGVPGLPAGVAHLVANYGKLDLPAVTAPAIILAKKGFAVTQRFQWMINWRKSVMNSAATDVFLQNNNVPEIGYTVVQPALAATLERFATHGADDFYLGKTSENLVQDMQADNGLIRAEDLAKYRVIERQPVEFDAWGMHIISAALPSSGGLVLQEIMGMLEKDKLYDMSRVERVHLLVEAMRRAYRHRAMFMGDSDFVDIPDNILHPTSAQLLEMRKNITDKATSSASLNYDAYATNDPYNDPYAIKTSTTEGQDTSHFCVIDNEGNMVSATLSINYPFGSGYLSPSTGILLNDEMDDFAIHKGGNAYGLTGGTANAVEPYKRMLSSMTPTIVRNEDETLIIGTPGGSRIISMILLAITEFAIDAKEPWQWLSQPRFHHQYLPDVIQHEPGTFSKKEQEYLLARGHTLKQVGYYGNMTAILLREGQAIGLTDSRGNGDAQSK
ncbi:MAG: gamma-glutamyltransferase [Mariprofundales bacterium]